MQILNFKVLQMSKTNTLVMLVPWSGSERVQ